MVWTNWALLDYMQQEHLKKNENLTKIILRDNDSPCLDFQARPCGKDNQLGFFDWTLVIGLVLVLLNLCVTICFFKSLRKQLNEILEDTVVWIGITFLGWNTTSKGLESSGGRCCHDVKLLEEGIKCINCTSTLKNTFKPGGMKTNHSSFEEPRTKRVSFYDGRSTGNDSTESCSEVQDDCENNYEDFEEVDLNRDDYEIVDYTKDTSGEVNGVSSKPNSNGDPKPFYIFYLLSKYVRLQHKNQAEARASQQSKGNLNLDDKFATNIANQEHQERCPKFNVEFILHM